MQKESSILGSPLAYRYTMFIDGDITEPKDYRDEFDLLENANENDVIIININSNGGDLSTTVQFISLIQISPAHVVTRLCGNAFSGASMILLAGDEIQVSPLSQFMAHGASSGTMGKVSDIVKYAKHSEKYVDNVMQNIYEGFLTETELVELAKGEEFWMECDEILERLDSREEHFKVKYEAEQQEQMSGMDFLDDVVLTKEQLAKLTKQQLIDWIAGEIDVSVDEDGKVVITEIEEIEDLPEIP